MRDQVILHNPARETELPKVVPSRLRILTPEEFTRLLEELPPRYTAMVLTDIETGMRWGELIALRPMDIDFLRRPISVHRVIVEVSRKITPDGKRIVVKPYPKDDEPRTLRISPELVEILSRHVASIGLAPDQLMFSSTGRADGNALSRNTFRTRVWCPAVERAGLGFHVRFHDLRDTPMRPGRWPAAPTSRP